MTKEQYFLMCEQMGFEPNWEETPIDESDLSLSCQYALLLSSILPDKIEGMNGMWLGKDFAGLMDIMEIYEITYKREVFDYLLVIINEYRKYYEEQRKLNERK